MSSSNSPCAACKFLRRKCTQECVYAPYFPPDNPQRFECVHRVFGASNVAKLLNELSASQREDAVKSLAYEAEARLRDPVFGCVGFISVLQNRLRQMQTELHGAKKELCTFIGPQSLQFILNNPGMYPPPPAGMMMPHQSVFNGGVLPPPPAQVLAGHGGGQVMMRDPQQQELFEAQQLAAAREHQQQQVMIRNYEQQQQEFIKLNSGFEHVTVAGAGGASVFGNQIAGGGGGELLSPSLGLGIFDGVGGNYQMQQQGEHYPHHHQEDVQYGHGHQHYQHHQHQHHHPIEAQLLLSPQHQQQQQPSESEDGRSFCPSS